jgi:hypothetical protein
VTSPPPHLIEDTPDNEVNLHNEHCDPAAFDAADNNNDDNTKDDDESQASVPPPVAGVEDADGMSENNNAARSEEKDANDNDGDHVLNASDDHADNDNNDSSDGSNGKVVVPPTGVNRQQECGQQEWLHKLRWKPPWTRGMVKECGKGCKQGNQLGPHHRSRSHSLLPAMLLS